MGHPPLIQTLLHSMGEQNSFLLTSIHFPEKMKIPHLNTQDPVCSDKWFPSENNLYLFCRLK